MGGLVWKNKKVVASIDEKKIDFMVRCVPFWYEGIGLMFKSKKNTKLLMFGYNFSTRMSIFSSFIPYDFLVVWVDKHDRLIESKIVKPGESGIIPSRKFRKLIEIPCLARYSKIVDFFLNNKNSSIVFSF